MSNTKKAADLARRGNFNEAYACLGSFGRADAGYQTTQAQALQALREIESLLKLHARMQAQNRNDWGFTEEVGEIKLRLYDIIKTMKAWDVV